MKELLFNKNSVALNINQNNTSWIGSSEGKIAFQHISSSFQGKNTECAEKKWGICMCNRSQYNVVVKYLKVVH